MPDIPHLPPIADAPLSVVLLLMRVEPKVEELVAAWIGFLDERKQPYEILLVSNAGGDTSLTEGLAERFPQLRIVQAQETLTEGEALRIGLTQAGCPLFFYTFCHPRYRPADLAKLLGQIDRVHLVGGYRAGRPVPFGWRFLGRLWRGCTSLLFGAGSAPLPGWLGWKRHAGAVLSRLFFGVQYRDAACPFRLFRREIFARIPLQSHSAFVHVEIIAKANFLGCLLGEEIALGETDQPVAADELVPPSRPLVKDAWKLFRHPDFGPPPKPSTEEPAAVEQPVEPVPPPMSDAW